MFRRGKSFAELETAVTLKVYTKVPSKYYLVDTETGRVFVGNEDSTWHELLENSDEKS